MIFRSTDGCLVNIIRTEYVSDNEYYKHIMKLVASTESNENITSNAEQYSSLREISKVVSLEKYNNCHNKM